MKTFVTGLTALLLLLSGAVYAQAGGTVPGGLCGVSLQAGDVISECNGNAFGNCPYAMPLVVRIFKETRVVLGTAAPLSLGQMIQEYHACRCVITYLGGGYFRVELGGGEITILIDDSI